MWDTVDNHTIPLNHFIKSPIHPHCSGCYIIPMVKIIPINVGKTRLKKTTHDWEWKASHLFMVIWGWFMIVLPTLMKNNNGNNNNNNNNNNNVNGKLMVNIPHYFLTHINIIN